MASTSSRYVWSPCCCFRFEQSFSNVNIESFSILLKSDAHMTEQGLIVNVVIVSFSDDDDDCCFWGNDVSRSSSFVEYSSGILGALVVGLFKIGIASEETSPNKACSHSQLVHLAAWNNSTQSWVLPKAVEGQTETIDIQPVTTCSRTKHVISGGKIMFLIWILDMADHIPW